MCCVGSFDELKWGQNLGRFSSTPGLELTFLVSRAHLYSHLSARNEAKRKCHTSDLNVGDFLVKFAECLVKVGDFLAKIGDLLSKSVISFLQI